MDVVWDLGSSVRSKIFNRDDSGPCFKELPHQVARLAMTLLDSTTLLVLVIK